MKTNRPNYLKSSESFREKKQLINKLEDLKLDHEM
jgi:hypothetical protein